MDSVKNIGYIINESREPVKEYKVISDSNKKIIAEGYLQTELSKKNRNQRIYGTKSIKSEVEGKRIKELLSTGNMKGQDGHPSDPSLSVQQAINPLLVSVKYLDIWMDGDNVASRFCGTNNNLGQAFNDDLADGELPSFSLRALGSVSNRGGDCYVENVRIVTWDRVYYPSHEKAYTTKILSESAQFDPYNNYAQLESVKSDKGVLIPITNASMTNFIKSESANIKSVMETFDTLFDSYRVLDGGRTVQMVTNEGSILMITLEDYVQNQIMKYCSDIY